MKQKLLEMIEVAVWLHTDELIFDQLNKNENEYGVVYTTSCIYQ